MQFRKATLDAYTAGLCAAAALALMPAPSAAQQAAPPAAQSTADWSPPSGAPWSRAAASRPTKKPAKKPAQSFLVPGLPITGRSSAPTPSTATPIQAALSPPSSRLYTYDRLAHSM